MNSKHILALLDSGKEEEARSKGREMCEYWKSAMIGTNHEVIMKPIFCMDVYFQNNRKM